MPYTLVNLSFILVKLGMRIKQIPGNGFSVLQLCVQLKSCHFSPEWCRSSDESTVERIEDTRTFLLLTSGLVSDDFQLGEKFLSIDTWLKLKCLIYSGLIPVH